MKSGIAHRWLVLPMVLFPSMASTAILVPDTLNPLVNTSDGSHGYDPASVEVEHGKVRVITFGVRKPATNVQIQYELNCLERTFRQVSIVEEHTGSESRCTSPSEPIILKPEKHLLPAALFQHLCP